MGAQRRRAGNLPAEVTSFVGRRQELAEAKRLLSGARMVTLTGPGGVGKTRLALRIGAELSSAFPDGVWFIDLAPLEAGELLAATVAATIGCRNQSGLPALAGHLRDQRLLLVLDNCEHLLEECAELAGGLLPAAPRLHILATSRRALRVMGEHLLEVPPLAVPDLADARDGGDEGDAGGAAEAAAQCEAVRLFADRVTAVLPEFAVTPDNAPAVLRLCRRLDGIPLAIELAAVRMRALSVEQILDRLDDRFRLLTRGSPTAMPRQRTLRALVDWSHDLCAPEERTLWARLSIFSGGCSLDSIEQVCTGDGIDADTVLDVVTELVDKSILLHRHDESGVRYHMLETLRQYGRERLVESGAEQALRLRHRDWCRDLAARAETEWFGEHQMEWLARIRDEQANIRAALDFCLSEPGQARGALEIAAAMWSHRLSWSSPSEGHRWLERALALERTPSPARAKALWVNAWLVLLRGDATAARPLLAECRVLAERLGDKAQLAGATHITGFAALLAGDFDRAFALLSEALAARRALGEEGHAWVVLFQLAMTAVLKDDPRSTALCAESLALCRRANAQWSVSYALWVSGLDQWRHGDLAAATATLRDALRLKGPCDDHLGIAQCLEVLAWVAAEEEQDLRAARLLGTAQTVWRSIGTSLSGLGHLARCHDRCAARLRERLGDKAFTRSFETGAQLALESAVAYALDERPGPDADEPARPADDLIATLTRREREIAKLVAEGMSNKDIAEALVIAPRTAEGHVENILRKLGFTSRTQIARLWGELRRPAER